MDYSTLLAGLDADRTALLLDIDGTLAPIHDDPTAVRVPDETLELLVQAMDVCEIVALVTGRTLAAATDLVPIDGITIAAMHGMHVRHADGSESIDEIAVAARPALDTARMLAQTVGWRYEDKELSITVHFRHAERPELTAQQMRAQMLTVLDPRLLEIADARLALEIRPRGARTKADAVRDLVASSPGLAHAIMVGDDLTDLDAFQGLDGSGVRATRVAVDSDEAPSGLLDAADLILPGQSDVAELLRRVLAGG